MWVRWSRPNKEKTQLPTRICKIYLGLCCIRAKKIAYQPESGESVDAKLGISPDVESTQSWKAKRHKDNSSFPINWLNFMLHCGQAYLFQAPFTYAEHVTWHVKARRPSTCLIDYIDEWISTSHSSITGRQRSRTTTWTESPPQVAGKAKAMDTWICEYRASGIWHLALFICCKLSFINKCWSQHIAITVGYQFNELGSAKLLYISFAFSGQ